MKIREVVKSDLDQVVPLMRAYIVDFYGRPNPGDAKIYNLATYLLEHPERGQQFAAESDNGLVGFATLYFSFSTLQAGPIAVLNDLYVDPAWRGQRVGEALFQHCLDYIRRHQYVAMQWETAKDNVVAQSLYRKMGGEMGDWLTYELH